MGRKPKLIEEEGSGASKKMQMLEKVCKQIQSKFGKESVNFLGNDKVDSIPRLKSGSIAIDKVTGGGYPLGRTIEIFGGESSGKTTACYHAIAEAQKAFPDKWCGFVDSEYCLAKGTFIYNADKGNYEVIENLVNKEIKVLSYIDGKFVEQNAIVKFSSNKRALRIIGSYAREIIATDNHKFLTQKGWLRADELQVGDVLYSPEIIPSDDTVLSDDEKYKLLGYWIGDGTINRAEVAVSDKAMINDLQNIVDKYFDAKLSFSNKLARIVKKDLRCYDISKDFLIEKLDEGLTTGQIGDIVGCSPDTIKSRIVGYELDKIYNLRKHSGQTKNKISLREDRIRSLPIKSEAYDFLSSFETFDKYSHKQHIPENLTLNQLRYVIAGLFLSDGSAIDPDKHNRCHIGFATTSKKLLYDIQASLQKFGIFSSYSSSTKSKSEDENYRVGYTLIVSGKIELQKFYDVFGDLLVGHKRERIEQSLATVREQHTYIKNINNGLIEIKINSIEEVDKIDTYDISVANTNFEHQNFLANGIVVHNSFDAEYASNIGVNVAELVIAQPDSGTDAFAMVQAFVENGASLIVIDSVAAMVPREEVEEEDYGKASVGTQARMMSKALRKLTAIIGKHQCVVIFTNQTRDKINVLWGNPEVTSGGKALQYYASIRLRMSRGGIIEEGTGAEKEKTSIRARVETVKNKTFPPFRKAEAIITFGKGIDDEASVLEELIERKIIERKGGWYVIDEGNTVQGINAVKEYLESNPDVYERFKQQLEKELKPVVAQDDNTADFENMTDDEIANQINDDVETGSVE